MNSPFAYRRTYPLLKGWSVEFVLDGSDLRCEWSPRMPTGKLAPKILPHYRAARENFFTTIGVPALVVEA